jgi:hypothetical protein
MRTFSESRAKRRRISRQTAWAFLTGNLALPGVGSLSAGRWIGGVQLALALGGMTLTLVFGFRFVAWYFENYDRLQGDPEDPLGVLREMWIAVRWALLGIGLFGVSWLWSLGTSFRILQTSDPAPPPPAPPPIA